MSRFFSFLKTKCRLDGLVCDRSQNQKDYLTGFNLFAENLNGRLAMIGFKLSLHERASSSLQKQTYYLCVQGQRQNIKPMT